MSDQKIEALGPTLLVHVELPQAESQEDLDELYRLAESAGGEVRDAIVCKRDVPDAKTFIGKGKVTEVADAVRAHDVCAEAVGILFKQLSYAVVGEVVDDAGYRKCESAA